ncbi:MAG: TRM11 family SAM-dependent methyltransferase [Planctomycetota bacterium]
MRGLKAGAARELVEAVLDAAPVAGRTHAFYRYPARFSPRFARSVIEAFTDPGDLVLDPFMGGGTTAVEALALGRRSVGTDISSLACFIARVKTTLLSRSDIDTLHAWFRDVPPQLNLRRRAPVWRDDMERDLCRNIGDPRTWPIRKAVRLALDKLRLLGNDRQCDFARCVLLRTGQWALDGRMQTPSAHEFRDRLVINATEMLDAAAIFAKDVRAAWRTTGCSSPSGPRLHNCSVTEVADIRGGGRLFPPRLIVTSPPYPGVHVLYHRWQVQGRRETPAPFLIAGCMDGHGSAYYTMGDRKQNALAGYYERLASSMSALAGIAGPDTITVQMLAFAEPEWQLPEYLACMVASGWSEVRLPGLANCDDGRMWRGVPNRKWHACLKGRTASSREVVLLHQLA